MDYPHPIIAREGWPFIAIALVASLALSAWTGIVGASPLWLITLFVLQFFRDPPRAVPAGDDKILAPADGRIVAIEKGPDPYLDRTAVKVSVFMNVFNVHSNRSPVDGVVQKVWYHPGKFVNAALAKASTENERNAVWVKRADGSDITFVQVAGLVARRILCYTKEGNTLRRGERYGFIRFGSRVDLYLPPDARVLVAIGERVSATETVLARLPLKQS